VGRRIRRVRGGIGGLASLLREHGEAIEYDLIRCGLRLSWLGTEALSWRDLLVLVRQCGPDTAFWRADPQRAVQTVEVDLLRSIQHATRLLVWQNTKDGAAGRNQPEPFRFPWESVRDEYAGDVMPLDELKSRLGWA